MIQNDPHGLILTLIAVSLVFLCLIVLSIIYSILGKLNTRKKEPKSDDDKDLAAAIAIALEQYSKKRIKNLKITIDDTLPSRWKNSIGTFRQNP